MADDANRLHKLVQACASHPAPPGTALIWLFGASGTPVTASARSPFLSRRGRDRAFATLASRLLHALAAATTVSLTAPEAIVVRLPWDPPCFEAASVSEPPIRAVLDGTLSPPFPARRGDSLALQLLRLARSAHRSISRGSRRRGGAHGLH